MRAEVENGGAQLKARGQASHPIRLLQYGEVPIAGLQKVIGARESCDACPQDYDPGLRWTHGCAEDFKASTTLSCSVLII